MNVVYDLVDGLKKAEMVVLGEDLNRYVSWESDGYEEVNGGFGFGTRNTES